MTTLLFLSIPAALVLGFAATVLFWTCFSQLRFLSYFRRREPRPQALGIGGWARFYRDTLKGAFTLLWWTLRAAFRAGMRQPAGPTTGRPVLCVHGLFLNDTTTWGIRQRLAALGRPTRAVCMGLPMPTPLAYVEPLTRVMRELADEFGDIGFDIVAHSIGGVITREVLRRNPDLASRVRQIVTLGSPHHGTAMLRWFHFGPVYHMLSPGSEYLASLPDFRRLAPRAGVTTFATRHDLVVYPVTTSHLPGARHVTLNAVSHLGLLTDSRALDEIDRVFSLSTP